MEFAMTSLKTLALCAVLALAPAAAFAQTAPASDAALTLTFPQLKTPSGMLLIAVYDSAEGWSANKSVRVAMAPGADAVPTARLEGLTPGRYGVKVFQDLNGDGRMGINPFGLPVEPYGFSRDARPNMGPPSFEDAAFVVTAGDNAQAIVLH
jgi:uncharacterized protein (DUF2141 family)